MAVFTVHLPPEGAAAAPDKVVFLRDGFSFPAFFFGPFWLAWKGAWPEAGGWTLLLALIAGLGAVFRIPAEDMSFAGLAAAIALGFEGGRLLAWRLQRRGFTEGDVVIGDDEEEAEEVFFGRLRAAAPRTLSAEAGA